MTLPSHPAVVEFHRDHGVDSLSIPYWKFPWAIDDETTTISTPPFQVEVTMALDDEQPVVTLDEELSTTPVTRTANSSPPTGE